MRKGVGEKREWPRFAPSQIVRSLRETFPVITERVRPPSNQSSDLPGEASGVHQNPLSRDLRNGKKFFTIIEAWITFWVAIEMWWRSRGKFTRWHTVIRRWFRELCFHMCYQSSTKQICVTDGLTWRWSWFSMESLSFNWITFTFYFATAH
jgi:hypothetical protein